MLMASLACLRGSFCIYQGEELGLKEAVLKFEDLTDPWGIATWPQWQGRDGCRTPIPWNKDSANGGFSNTDDKPWLPVCKKHLPLAVSEQDNNAESMLNFTRALFKWRRDHPLLKFGDIEFCDFGEDVLGFVRYDDEKSYLCVFNLSNTDHALDGIEETNILYGLSSSLEAGTLSLSPFGFAICSFV
jgi:alpha-glucosidase